MTVSENSSEKVPEFSAISAKTNEPVDLPKDLVWESLQLDEDEAVVYVDEKGEKQIITTQPFDEDKYYRVILFDYST
jgi:hypothetical protein